MIERFFEKLIEELGATGLLVIGLYFILYRPLNTIATYITRINHELQKVIFLLDDAKSKFEASHGKD